MIQIEIKEQWEGRCGYSLLPPQEGGKSDWF